MLRRVVWAVAFLISASANAVADQPEATRGSHLIGHGRLFSNDFLGDGRDRWQSGSYVLSFIGGARTEGTQPFGSLREYRLRSSVIASDGFGPAPGDRPYAGTVSVGVHSHFGTDKIRSRVGVDVTLVGPRTRLSAFQRRVHDALGVPRARFTEFQLGNDTLVGVSSETSRLIALGPGVTARPFAEVQIGPEDMIRVGADVFVGGGLADDLLIRDVTTGQLYTGLTDAANTGFSFVFGADTARVTDSIFLPGGDLAEARARRDRARAGLHWHGAGETSVFYGLTYLGPEFEGQREGQITGSVRLNFNF